MDHRVLVCLARASRRHAVGCILEDRVFKALFSLSCCGIGVSSCVFFSFVCVEIQLPSLFHQIDLLVELARACNSNMVSEHPGSNPSQHSIKINICGLPKKIQ
jgi:hypothetical protein